MNDSTYKQRMQKYFASGNMGNYMVDRTKIQENQLFKNDPNYQRGMLYDWNLEPLEVVDFKFEKIKTWHAEGSEVEYWIRFRPDYNPEAKFKNLYHRPDGKERYGFYIDVTDRSKGTVNKWLIMGKDDRVAFDRYSVFRCNWIFEWVENNYLLSCLGCIRSAQDGSFSTGGQDKLGGTSVEGDISMLIPSSVVGQRIKLKQRFIISDNMENPMTFEVSDITDTSSLGTTRLYLKEVMHNPHTDFFGNVNAARNIDFVFDTPIDDLPDGFGGPYHAICNCIHEKKEDRRPACIVELHCDESVLYVKGAPAVIRAKGMNWTSESGWQYTLDGQLVGLEELAEAFVIEEFEDSVSVQAISRDLVKYTLGICLQVDEDYYSNWIELEIKS